MIGFIRGKVLSTFKIGKSVSNLVVWPLQNENELGVGYTITVSELFSVEYPVGSIVSLWLYNVHSEKEAYVIGLESVESMKLFIDLVGVSGVGPKTALNIITVLHVEGLQAAILERDVKALTKVPGLGQKTAAKIIIELGGKGSSVSAVAATSQKIGRSSQKYSAVIATLQKLGYTTQQAKEAVEKAAPALDENSISDTAEQVKLVLAYLG